MSNLVFGTLELLHGKRVMINLAHLHKTLLFGEIFTLGNLVFVEREVHLRD